MRTRDPRIGLVNLGLKSLPVTGGEAKVVRFGTWVTAGSTRPVLQKAALSENQRILTARPMATHAVAGFYSQKGSEIWEVKIWQLIFLKSQLCVGQREHISTGLNSVCGVSLCDLALPGHVGPVTKVKHRLEAAEFLF